tara:strand:- start:8857 stop:9051 length:195 start_codon:yes stop_codon:yes gene_type:complete
MLSFSEFNRAMLDGDPKIWRHLDAMERGTEGGFARKIRDAMGVADGHNQRTLYEAFPHLFQPKF